MAKRISYQILKQRRLVVNKEKRGGIGVFPENKNDREENISQRRRKPDERCKEEREREAHAHSEMIYLPSRRITIQAYKVRTAKAIKGESMANKLVYH